VLQVLSGVAQVSASVDGAGRLELFAVRRAGTPTPQLLAEAYDDAGLVAAGEIQVWELNQAIAALVSQSGQARRLTLRDDGRHHGGYLDVLAEDDPVQVAATGLDAGRRAEFTASARGLAGSLNVVLRHYLTLSRATGRTIVLPDAFAPAQPASARAASIRPVP
jgi:hypothetical protein